MGKSDKTLEAEVQRGMRDGFLASRSDGTAMPMLPGPHLQNIKRAARHPNVNETNEQRAMFHKLLDGMETLDEGELLVLRHAARHPAFTNEVRRSLEVAADLHQVARASDPRASGASARRPAAGRTGRSSARTPVAKRIGAEDVRNLRAAIERLHPYYDAKYREVLRKIERDADARLDDAEMRALLEAARDVKLTSDQRSSLDAFVARQHQGRRGP